MKAIFGKLSILCFVVSVIAVATLFYAVHMILMPFPEGIDDSVNTTPFLLLMFSLIVMPLGFLLSVVGKMVKEVPQRYATIGLYLNMIPIVLYLVWGFMPFRYKTLCPLW